MTDSTTHLTEEERQTLADGTMSAGRAEVTRAHLNVCAACANDVERLERLVTHARGIEDPTSDLGDLWPGVRSRIEHAKVVALAPEAAASRRRVRRWTFRIAGLAAVLVIVLWLGARSREAGSGAPVAGATRDTSTALAFAADSVRLYREEAQILLNRLTVTRSMLEPSAADALDKDLAVIDSAIAELQSAIARDPRNPALQQLLAISYRQKIDVLERAANAG